MHISIKIQNIYKYKDTKIYMNIKNIDIQNVILYKKIKKKQLL